MDRFGVNLGEAGAQTEGGPHRRSSTDELWAALLTLPPDRRISNGKPGGFMKSCPAHDDRTPSLSAWKDDEVVYLKCHAGCDGDDIIARLGFGWRDRYPEREPRAPSLTSGRNGCVHAHPTQAAHAIRYEWTMPGNPGRSYVQQRWDYPDHPARCKRIKVSSLADLGVEAEPFVYYVPPGVELDGAKEVVITEGARAADAHALAGDAVVALKSAGVRPTAEQLRAMVGPTKRVIVSEDNDSAGWALTSHLQAVATEIGLEVGVIRFEGERSGFDAADALAADLSAPELHERLPLAGAPPADLLKRRRALRAVRVDAQHTGRHLRLVRAADTRVLPTEWAWQGRLPTGSLALLGGREGIGKSTLWAELAGKLTRGELPGIWAGSPRGVIVAATEDSWERQVVPRLMAAKADLQRVSRVDAVAAEGFDDELLLPEDLVELETLVGAHRVGLVVLDPLLSRLEAGLDTHKDAEVRRALEPLVRVAASTDAVFLGLIHVNKSQDGDPLNVLMGSRAFTAVPRAVLFLARHPEDEAATVLGQPKNQYGPVLPNELLRIEGVKVAEVEGRAVLTSRIVWEGLTDLTLGDVIGGDMDVVTATGEATEWLRYYLTRNGRTARRQVVTDGKAVGHPESALKRAAKKLKVRTEREGYPSTSYWELPVSSLALESEPTELAEPTGETCQEPTTLSEGGPLQSAQSVQSAQLSQTGAATEPTDDTVHVEYCEDYLAHRNHHRNDGGRWVCDRCDGSV